MVVPGQPVGLVDYISILWFLGVKLRLSGLATVTLTPEPLAFIIIIIWVWIDLGRLGWGHAGLVVLGAAGRDSWLALVSLPEPGRWLFTPPSLRIAQGPLHPHLRAGHPGLSTGDTAVYPGGPVGICAPQGCLPPGLVGALFSAVLFRRLL